MNSKVFLYGSLLLYLMLFNVSGLLSNERSTAFNLDLCPHDFYKIDLADNGKPLLKWVVQDNPFSKTSLPNKAKSPDPSDQCIIKEGQRVTADRGPEPALLNVSGVFLCHPLNENPLFPDNSSVKLSSWKGSSAKIRPPPSSIWN